MSLFSVNNSRESLIHPNKAIINGEIIGSVFSGKVEMTFLNDSEKLDIFQILIGQLSSNNVCLHDFKILLDNNPLILNIMEKNEAEQIFKKKIGDDQIAAFGQGIDSYASISLPNVLPHQTVTVSAEFETSISFPSKSTIEVTFPLTYPTKNDDEILKSDNFQFSCKFNSFPLKSNSISSNPDGKLNLADSTYTIDHIDESVSQISITYDLNPPTLSDDLDDIRIPTKKFLFDK